MTDLFYNLFDKNISVNYSTNFIGTIKKLHITENIKTIIFNPLNFQENVIDINDYTYEEYTLYNFSRNKIIYILDKDVLHCIKIDNDLKINFPTYLLRSNEIYIFTCYYVIYDYDSIFRKIPELNIEYITQDNKSIVPIYETIVDIILTNINYNTDEIFIKNLLNKLRLFKYYELDSNDLIENAFINDYGFRLTNIINICIALDININEIFNNEILKIEYVEPISPELNNNINFNFITQIINNGNKLNLINDLIKLEKISVLNNSYPLSFVKNYSCILIDKFDIDSINNIYFFTSRRLISLYNIILYINKIDGLTNVLDIFIDQSSERIIQNIIFEIDEELINQDILDNILQSIQSYYKYSFLYGTQFNIKKKYAKTLIKKIKKYNNNTLDHIKFTTDDKEVKELLEHYKNNKIIKESDSNLLNNLIPPRSRLGEIYNTISCGSIIKIDIDKNMKELIFKTQNYIKNYIFKDDTNPPIDTYLYHFDTNYYIYLLDDNILYAIKLNDGDTIFSLDKIRSKTIYLFIYYFGSFIDINQVNIATDYFDASVDNIRNYNDYPQLILHGNNKYNELVDIQYKYITKLINQFTNYYDKVENIKTILNKVNLIRYIENQIDKNYINNYGEYLTNIFNLCLAFKINVNDILFNELSKVNTYNFANNFLLVDKSINAYNSLYMTSCLISAESWNLLNRLCVDNNIGLSAKVNFRSMMYKFINKFNINDFAFVFDSEEEEYIKIFVLIYYRRFSQLMFEKDIILKDLILKISYEDELDNIKKLILFFHQLSADHGLLFSNYTQYNEYKLNITYQFDEKLIINENFENVLDIIANYNTNTIIVKQPHKLYNTKVYITKKYATELLYKLSKFNNGLEYMTFMIEDNHKEIRELIYKYNNNSYDNITFIIDDDN